MRARAGPPERARRFHSHSGRLQGYSTMMGYLADHDASTVELTNDEDGAPNPFMTEMWMVVGLLIPGTRCSFARARRGAAEESPLAVRESAA